jgi:hypothetical protein
MSERSLEICTAFWKGGTTNDLLFRALLLLSESEQRAWQRLVVEAAVRELEATPVALPPSDSIDEGYRFVVSHLPSERERRSFRSAVREGKSIDDEKACLAMRTILNGAELMEPRQQEDFLRAFARALTGG